ncbi:13677_t:CDS:10 [Ambispora gerdemannii]|uniref:13677_t:CDS:1 n=1 Tax=Ambispora gerdemannii TaxID=144530 RepID=A0A9N8YM04_9GLOM|nr:13677_t:CDS:10 [Ambispora gerdemannii]
MSGRRNNKSFNANKRGNRQNNANRERNNAQEESSSGRGRGGGDNRNRNNRGRFGPAGSNYSQRNYNPLSREEAVRLGNNQKELMNKNFVSSSLSLEDSEAILPMKHGDVLKDYWRRAIHRPLETQRYIRQFINSCIITADQKGLEAEDLVGKLGMDEGLDRIREIVMFPVSSDAGTSPQSASFQRVILPFFALLTRKEVARCNLERNVNAIFSVLYSNVDAFIGNQVMNAFDKLFKQKSLEDRSISSEKILEMESDSIIVSSFFQPFMLIGKLIKELLRRFKEASVNESVQRIVKRLDDARLLWEESIRKDENVYNDSLAFQEHKNYALEILENEFTYLKKMLKIIQKNEPKSSLKVKSREGLIADLKARYDPPGELSERGPRHDNDFTEISKISIIPTQNEIISATREPFLPFCDPNSLHFLPDGVERLLDTNFRLLREDMLNPIRLGIINFLEYLSEDANKEGKKSRVSLSENGRFKFENGMDNGDLIVYNNVQFTDIIVDRRRGFSTRVSFSAPNIKGSKSKKERIEYWSKAKRLMNGSLVCLLWPIATKSNDNDNKITHKLFFGTVVNRDEERLAKDENWIEIDINFIDHSVYPIALADIAKRGYSNLNIDAGKYIVESTGVYLESYYHVLKRLQSTNPSEFPFERYLTPSESHQVISPPLYARAPQHEFILSRTKKCKHVPNQISLKVNEPNSQQLCMKQLKEAGHVDETQAKAIVESLSREIALIEGPPGTGKSYVGVEIVEILITNHIYPILVICYTNHALDQFLEDILERGIDRMVRLGSRSKSERIQQFGIDEIARYCEKSPAARKLLYSATRDLEELKEEIDEVKTRLLRSNIFWRDVQQILYTEYPELYLKFMEKNHNFDFGEEWVNKNAKNSFDYWAQYQDIKLGEQMKKGINKKKANSIAHDNPFNALGNDDDEVDEDQIIEDLENENEITYWENWEPPKGNRKIDVLMDGVDIWQMSKVERKKILDHLKEQIFNECIETLKDLQTRHEEKRKEIENVYDETRRRILERTQIIGMTTSGAAKFQSIIASIGPRVIICEEAGEVLEAHILTSLTSNTQHLIMIGDHLQLRPHIATYYLDMDSDVGKNYQLNKSLFERLVHGDNAMKLPMSQLTTQRRMRPEISDLVRYTLYSELQDAPETTKYPKVSGVQHNVFFLDHHKPEDKSGSIQLALQSHSNKFEADMIVEMVKYLVRNGYNKPDDIAILTPYLDSKKSNFTKLNTYAAKRSLQQQVTLRTVDNFQGEEAKIVIISLVRNSANTKEGKRAKIGFLDSPNRTNVLLSRAKHGMFLLGDAQLFQNRSPMWNDVIKILRQRNQVGKAFPVLCEQHPHYTNNISQPGDFVKVSPDGGCMEPCQFQLPCGHQCPYKCHADDREHIGVFCQKPCVKLHVECQHPCQLRCGDECGLCILKVGDLTLQCGHVYEKPHCYQAQKPESLKCRVRLTRKLVRCEHELKMFCHEDVNTKECFSECGKLLKCGHACKAACSECQTRSIRANNDTPEFDSEMHIKRTNHAKKCQQICGSVCAEPCDWSCVHQGECPLTCGAPCSRLPCNERCQLKLECGHQCPGVCGDICPSKEFCPSCATENVKSQVVDLIMQETFEAVDWNEEHRLVVLDCGHCFTMETMDGMMDIEKFYTSKIKNGEIKWSETKELPSEHTEIKVCPNCRGGINSHRYGRIIKKATLNLQTKKFLQKHDKNLQILKNNLDISIKSVEHDREKFLEKMVESLKKYNRQEEKDTQTDFIVKVNKRRIPELAPINKFKEILEYGIPKAQQTLWNKHVKKFISTYTDLTSTIIASTNPPYKKAYEAAVANLYRRKTEIDIEQDLLERFDKLSFTSNDLIKQYNETLDEVKIRPKVDKKIYLDAFSEIVNIQRALFQESCKVMEILRPLDTTLWEAWKIFSLTILESASSHIDHIIKTSYQRHNRNYVLASIEHARLAYQVGKFTISYSNTITDQMAKDIETNCCEVIKKKLEKLRIELVRLNAEHLEKQCDEMIEDILKDVENLRIAARNKTQLTKEQKLEIVRAMQKEFLGSGHWYECPNGHPYTIGECGGAMEQSRCPDCGAAIGGGGHRLTSNNRRNEEFDTIN